MVTVIVVDLEATCWYPRKDSGNQEQEIIAVGAARLELEGRDYRVTPLECVYVQPQESTISDFCTQLTGITQEFLDKNGTDLMDAMERIREHLKGPGVSYSWASFGLDDKLFLQKQCARFGVPFPFSQHHYDIQGLLQVIRGDRKMGLSKSLSSFGLNFEGTHHNAMDDAVNAARVFGELVKRYRRKDIS